jgi:hypothetical protein
MLKRFYGRATAKDGEAKKDGGDGDAGGFPAVENIFLIFGGSTIDMSNSQRKRERHEVLAAEKAPPSLFDCSEDAITFSREDTRTASLTRVSTHWWSTRSSGMRGSRRC